MTDKLERLLRQNKLQVTAQRIAILRALSARPHARPTI
jgi:Fe2+ or Zn2+ uptake regulation protein